MLEIKRHLDSNLSITTKDGMVYIGLGTLICRSKVREFLDKVGITKEDCEKAFEEKS